MNRDAIGRAVERWVRGYLASPPELASATAFKSSIISAREALVADIVTAAEACDLSDVHCREAGPASFVRRLRAHSQRIKSSLETLRGEIGDMENILVNYQPLVTAVMRLVDGHLGESTKLLAEVCWEVGIPPTGFSAD